MKRFFCLILIVAMLAALSLSLVSCGEEEMETQYVSDAAGFTAATAHVEKKDGLYERMQPVGCDIVLTADFTIRTDDDFFTESLSYYSEADEKDLHGRALKGMVLDGQGHTITITGETDGSLGKYNMGMFATVMGCEIKNLNVVYDLDLTVSGDTDFGGIVGMLETSKITNCTVRYAKNTSLNTTRFGGVAGWMSNGSTIENCTVSGNLNASDDTHLGGVVAIANGQVLSCKFDGGIKGSNLTDAYIGGVSAACYGEIAKCTVELDYLSVVGNISKWTNADAYSGALVGYVGGSSNVHDCVIRLSEGAYVEAADNTKGLFHVKMYTGIVAGFAKQGAGVKNIFVDAKGDGAVNIRFPENSRSINLGIHTSEEITAEKIYYAEDLFVQEHTETVSDITVTPVSDSFDSIYSFDMAGKSCSVRACYTLMDELYHLTSMILQIDDAQYHLTTKVDDTTPSYFHFKADIEGFHYDVAVRPAMRTVEFSKAYIGTGLGGATFVTDCSQIELGGEESVWTVDESGKPTLK